MPGDDKETIVTMAILGEKIDAIKQLLERSCSLQAQDHDAILEAKGEIKLVRDRQSALSVANAVASAALATIAAWIGSR